MGYMLQEGMHDLQQGTTQGAYRYSSTLGSATHVPQAPTPASPPQQQPSTGVFLDNRLFHHCCHKARPEIIQQRCYRRVAAPRAPQPFLQARGVDRLPKVGLGLRTAHTQAHSVGEWVRVGAVGQ